MSLGMEQLHKKKRLRTCIRQGIGKRHSLPTVEKYQTLINSTFTEYKKIRNNGILYKTPEST